MKTNKSISASAVIMTAIICATCVALVAMAMASGALDAWIQQSHARKVSQYAVQYQGQRIVADPAARSSHPIHQVVSDAAGDVSVINDYIKSRKHRTYASETYGYSPYESALRQYRPRIFWHELRTVGQSGQTVRDPKYLEYLALRADAYAYAERDLIKNRVSAAMAEAELDNE